MARVTIAASEDDLAARAADRITAAIEEAVRRHGRAMVCLTGGSTPRLLYTRLSSPDAPWAARIPWPLLHLFWGDERHVPPDSRDSNFGMANETLLVRVPVPAAQVHRMRGEYEDANAAAAEYDQTLRDAFASAGRTTLTFDLMLLGIGEDAHIASLFPGSPLLTTDAGATGSARAAAVYAAHLRTWRITLTPHALLDSHRIVVLGSGVRKAPAIAAALQEDEDVTRWPAQLLRTAGDRVEWLVDRDAASGLRQG